MPQARAFLKICCENAELPSRELKNWVRTRWASLYTALGQFLKLKKVWASANNLLLLTPITQAINLFTTLADDDPRVPVLANHGKQKRRYSDFHLRPNEWEKLALVHEVLKVHCPNLV